ncbi:APC family permease [Anaeromyxobacter diazotrophicus]|uniref:Amino acid transporter n=1 Tax=Anaeromyxobacter diazotrophicus TaxID=2590199 RepID=A0A7I9VS58_9BACT|nr:APC family permease [Anaeromyxobacter diazotrophicus]GEJ58757.1 amino acid transporter [Anaeromyxobacter diazotrophicus]
MDPHGKGSPPLATPPPAPRVSRLRRVLLGAPRNVQDPNVYHSISLVAFLAWVGLGADGLSSSAYGPDEAFRALGEHHELAVALALATALTVIVISVAYSQIIKRFPFGGGGYVVASRLLGARWGVVSGSALLVDYILTISVSIASGADQVFSVLPPGWAQSKLLVEAVVIGLLVLLNLRGVKESVTVLTPIFLVFLLTHIFLIVGGVAGHAVELPRVTAEVHQGFSSGLATLGLAGMFGIFVRAYSMGAGTYTGIEAVSNGLQIMREPKVETARRTMVYMSVSLALTAGGILLLYMLFHVVPEGDKTMNALLLERFAGGFRPGGLPVGTGYVWVTLGAEAALLFVAAQAGFIDGPRVMANMAHDSWLPHRFGQLSDRLTMQDGVLLMGGASIATLLYTHGNITALVTMYSINVFVTFSLSQIAMLRYWLERRREGGFKRGAVVHGAALLLCLAILAGTVYEKFGQGGWITLAVTGVVIALCFTIRRHYRRVQDNLKRLDEIMNALPAHPVGEHRKLDPKLPTAVLLVGAYSGLGIHQLLTIQRLFPSHYKNFVFLSVGVIDSATMKGVEEVEAIRAQTEQSLRRYVDLARRLGLAADYRMAIGTEAVAEAERLCLEVGREFSRAIFFAGKLVFEQERWYQRLLHNETAYQLQRRLQFAGLNAMVLPVRVMEPARAA